MTDYRSVNVVCPFYRRETELKITCEGITDDCLVSVQFFTKKKKDQHQRIFCNKNYPCCEVCQMLMSKYEEE